MGNQGSGSGVARGAFSALLQDLVRGADPGSGWDRALRPGAVIGRFELVRELGRGGFGVVFEARDRELGRAVALKAVRAGDRRDRREERLLSEAEAAARLSHPNIVTLHDVGRCEHGPYLVLELLRGQTLAQRLQQGRMPVPEALRVAAAIARGLAHAHAEGVIHRDLTPGNVFLCHDGQVKLLDLGMAHAFGRRRVEGGTPGFMAPEQRCGAPEDERTDVFALGAVLYRMLSGELPFPEDGPSSSRQRPAPELDVPGVPGLGPLVARMLARDPVDRPRDAGEVMAALDAFEGELGRTAPDGNLPRVHRRSPRRALAAVVVAGAFLALAAAVAVLSSGRRAVAPPTVPAATATPPAIAVLPFLDLSPARDQEYLADGVAEEILNALAQVEELQVIGRTSSFSFKGKTDDLPTIARKLGVGRLLEGSVRREGSHVRIAATLVDDRGHHVWSQSYERELTGIFALQDEIAAAVVRALRVKLVPGGAPSTEVRGTSSVEAYREFLLGRQLALQGTREGYLRAIAAFERAVAADPDYGPAWARLASARWSHAGSLADVSVARALERRAMAEADRAIAVRPGLADGYALRGIIRSSRIPTEWEGAEADLRRALELNPRDPVTLVAWGWLLATAHGRLDEGMAAARRSTEMDPLSPNAWNLLAWIATGTGDFPLARAALERALEIAPEGYVQSFNLSVVLVLEGKGAEARAAAERIGHPEYRLVALALADHLLGRTAAAQRALDELTRRASDGAAYQIAQIHAFRGDRGRALEWLERAWVQRDPGLAWIPLDQMFRPLRGEPRFTELLRKLRLPGE